MMRRHVSLAGLLNHMPEAKTNDTH